MTPRQMTERLKVILPYVISLGLSKDYKYLI